MQSKIGVLKYICLITVFFIILPFLSYGFLLICVPISRPNEQVKSYMLKEVPITTSWQDTLKIIEEKEWIIHGIESHRGLRINSAAGNVSFASDDEMRNGTEYNEKVKIVGVKAICVEIGEYYGPFHTAVFAYFAFDNNDELIEIAIKRDVDSI